MQKNELTFEDKINLISQNLKKLIESKKEVFRQKQTLLSSMKEAIEEARKAEISYLKIAQLCRAGGLEVTKTDLSVFCRDVLGEIIPERKSKKKRDKQTLPSNSKKIAQSSH